MVTGYRAIRLVIADAHDALAAIFVLFSVPLWTNRVILRGNFSANEGVEGTVCRKTHPKTGNDLGKYPIRRTLEKSPIDVLQNQARADLTRQKSPRGTSGVSVR